MLAPFGFGLGLATRDGRTGPAAVDTERDAGDTRARPGPDSMGGEIVVVTSAAIM